MAQSEQLQVVETDYQLVSAASIVNFCELMREFGVDGEALLRRHQLHPQFIQLPNAQVRYDRLATLLTEAAVVANCPHLGLLLGERMPLESIDLILLSSHSDTFGEALLSLDKYQRLFGDGFTFQLDVEGKFTCWKYFHDSYGDYDHRVLSDLTARVLIDVLSFLLGDQLKIEGVSLDTARPENINFYENFLGYECIFEGNCISVTFPTALLSLPMSGNKRMRDIMLSYVEGDVLGSRGDLVGQVSHLISVLLPTGRCCIENVSDVLGIHRRTLQKKLNLRRISFKDILREKREEKALHLLGNTDIGVQDITAALGYSETANFLHAFKRWTGKAPSAWRRDSVCRSV